MVVGASLLHVNIVLTKVLTCRYYLLHLPSGKVKVPTFGDWKDGDGLYDRTALLATSRILARLNILAFGSKPTA